MNRRDLIRTLLGTAAASGTVMAASVTEAKSGHPFFLVLEATGSIDMETAERLSEAVRKAFTGTPFEGVKCLVLGDGLKLKAIDANGRMVTEPVTLEPVKRRRKRTTSMG